jgi:ribosomal protein S18 acetylase RimI-like enzyme
MMELRSLTPVSGGPGAYDLGEHATRTQPADDFHIRPFVEADTDQVIALWSRCGLLRPWNDPKQDIARKLRVQRELFMVGELAGRLVAVMMVGYEGHRGWVNYLAIEPELQQRGLGRTMMAEAERRLLDLGCPKIQLQVRESNVDAIAFYRQLGYRQDAVVSMGKRLVKDDGA